MKILKVISEHKKPKRHKCVLVKGKEIWVDIPQLSKGHKRVEAIVEERGVVRTRHIDIPKSDKYFNL